MVAKYPCFIPPLGGTGLTLGGGYKGDRGGVYQWCPWEVCCAVAHRPQLSHP